NGVRGAPCHNVPEYPVAGCPPQPQVNLKKAEGIAQAIPPKIDAPHFRQNRVKPMDVRPKHGGMASAFTSARAQVFVQLSASFLLRGTAAPVCVTRKHRRLPRQ